MLEWQSAGGAGTAADYQRWALAYPSVGFVTVTPIAYGPGTVSVVITDLNNRPFTAPSVVDGLQAQLDPPQAQTTLNGSHTLPVGTINVATNGTTGFDLVGSFVLRTPTGPQVIAYTGKTASTFTGCTGGTGVVGGGASLIQGGKGAGLAPIGAIVAVSTPTLKAVVVAATVVPDTGYSLDGAGGTIPIRSDVNAAIKDYIDRLPPGGDVVFNHVQSRFFAVTGVTDVTGLTLNGAATSVVVAGGEVAYTSDLTGIA
jgi:uncharacterized phage protein gp47/JayE